MNLQDLLMNPQFAAGISMMGGQDAGSALSQAAYAQRQQDMLNQQIAQREAMQRLPQLVDTIDVSNPVAAAANLAAAGLPAEVINSVIRAAMQKQEQELMLQQQEALGSLAGGGDDALMQAALSPFEPIREGARFMLERQDKQADRDLRQQESMLRAEERQTLEQERKDERSQRVVESDAQKFALKIDEAKIAEPFTALKDLRAELESIPQGEDIPGIGLTGYAPAMLLSEKGSNIRRYGQSLLNSVLSMRSGAAVTTQEAERLRKELGSGSSDREFLSGVKLAEDILSRKLKNISAGFKPEALELYQQRGGDITFGDFGKKESPSKIKLDKPKEDMTLEELEQLLRGQ